MSGQQAEPVRAGQPGTRLIVMDGYGMSSIEGIIVGGTKDEDGTWDLDGRFVLLTDDGERLTVNGWCCLIEVEEAGEEGREGRIDGRRVRALPRRAGSRKGQGLRPRHARPLQLPARRGRRAGSSRNEDAAERTAEMRLIEKMRLVLGAMLVAAGLYALMAAPGLVSDLDSSVGKLQLQEARR